MSEQRPRREAGDGSDRVGQPRTGSHRGGRHDRARTDCRQRVADLAHAVPDRVMQLGERRRRPRPRQPAGRGRPGSRWRRPCSRRTARSVRARASAGSRRPRRRRVARASRGSRSPGRSPRGRGSRTAGRGGDRGATARRRPARQAVAAESVEHDHRGPRVACGRDQPPGQGDAVIGREADRLVVEAEIGRASPGAPTGSGSNGCTTGLDEQLATRGRRRRPGRRRRSRPTARPRTPRTRPITAAGQPVSGSADRSRINC